MPRVKALEADQSGPTVTTTLNMPTQAAPMASDKEEKSPTWFWDLLQDIPKDKWGGTYDVMGFRLDPQVGRVPGAKGFLCQVMEPITLQWVEQNYGGGKFRFILQKNSKFFRSHEFDVVGQPKYDLSREAPHSHAPAAGTGNADFQKEFIAVLREELARSRDSQQNGGQGNEQVVQMLTNASEKAMEIVTKQMPQTQSGVSQIREMVSTLKEMGIIGAQSGNGSGNAMMDTFLKVATDKLLTPVNPLEQLTQLAGLIDVVEKIRGGGAGGGEPKDWKAMLVQHMPEVLSTVKEVFTPQPAAAVPQRPGQPAARPQPQQPPQQPAARPQQPGQAQQPAQPAAAVPAVQSTGPLETVRRTDTVATPEEVAAAQIQEATVENPGTQEQYDEALKVQIVNLIRMGASGETIADLLEDCKPQMRQELGKYTPEMITQFFAADPILKLAVEDPRWQQVLAAARAYILEDIEA